MPGEFLTDAQELAYGHFVGPPSNQQLSRYFHLDDADRERISVRRRAHNKLGFALQSEVFFDTVYWLYELSGVDADWSRYGSWLTRFWT